MRTFRFRILTPQAEFLATEAEMVKLHLADGDYVLLAGHEPVTAALDFGLLQYRSATGELHEVVCADGFAEMSAEGLFVFTGQCVNADDLDRAQEKLEADAMQTERQYEQSLVSHHSASVFLTRAMERRHKAKYK